MPRMQPIVGPAAAAPPVSLWRQAVWATPLGALFASARAIRELAAEVFCRIGLLPPPYAPPVSHEPVPAVSEADAMKRLASFFEELEAARRLE